MSFLAIVVAAAETAVDAPGAAASGGLPQLDVSSWPSQLFWLVVFFGLLYWSMAGYFLPRIGATIEERRDSIADDLDQAAEFKQQADDAERGYNEALAAATAKAQAIAAETREAVAAEISEISAEADQKAAAALAGAEARISAMKADAAGKVREAAVETTRAVVAALLDETPTAEAVAAAISNGERRQKEVA